MTGAAVVLALGVAVLARETPDARSVRVESEDDARLAALSTAVRAELAAAGFTILVPRDATLPAGVVRLRMADEHCAVVTATAIETGKVFQSLVGCEGVPDRRAGDEVALQLAEWMDAATWLPPPPDEPPPPSVRQDADLSEPGERPAVRAPSFLDTVDAGTAVMRTPALGTFFGVEVAVSKRRRSPVVAGATPFARLALSYEWLGTGASDAAGERFDTRYGTLGAAGGLSRRLGRSWSAEVNAHLGVTVVWMTARVAATDAQGVFYRASGHVWDISPGAGAAIVRELSQRSALALEARASWLSPALLFQTAYASVGGSHWPAITVAMSLRMKP